MIAASNPKRIKYLIIGAGPCGLGAAHRLHELGEKDWLVIERENFAGGLATSFQDPQGFTWDVGGHVVHSHYDYFDKVFQAALGKGVCKHQREAWVWLYNKFIPYPFQNNLRHLPPEAQWDCVSGLINLPQNAPGKSNAQIKNPSFQDWILANFGSGIAEHFLFPYNRKMWAYPLQKMNSTWVGDRVANVNLERSLKNIILGQDDLAWGPNSVFYFPAKGGTGALWQAIAEALPQDHFKYGQTVKNINATTQTVALESGEALEYENLITTLPLTNLLTKTRFPAKKISWLQPNIISKTKRALFSSSVHVVGIGLAGQPPTELATKCWLYFPEADLPFFRVTVFSNYAAENVPKPGKQWSLMCEVSESSFLPRFFSDSTGGINSKALVKAVVTGLIKVKLISTKDEIVSTWSHTARLGYPTPTSAREVVLEPTLKALEKYRIFSRGRFGAWKYEVSNMDHTFMQGVEVVNRLVQGQPEITLWQPNLVNHRA